ncbi:hypothetical protein [Nguyenibacter vanlangensis]|nr:hypothetical protein [Nguyenibacter vanlangensis]
MLREVPGNAAAASIAFFVSVAPAQAMVPRPFDGRSPKNASAN